MNRESNMIKKYKVKLKEEYYETFCPARYSEYLNVDKEFIVVEGIGWDGKLNYKNWDEEHNEVGVHHFKKEELIFIDE